MTLFRSFAVSVAACAGVFAIAGRAGAQFAEPSLTSVRERIVGQLIAVTGTPEPAAGDMIGAFYDSTKLCGRFVFTGTTVTRNFSIELNGDVTTTAGIKEGPSKDQRLTFKFYDASANAELPMTVLTKAGEAFNLTFQGTTIVPLPIPLPGLDLVPSRDFDLKIGASGGSGGDGDGSGSGKNKYDINADGRVTIEDSALILKQITGGSVAPPSTRATQSTVQATGLTGTGTSNTDTAAAAATAAPSMDVNGDQRVDVNDAIEVLRNKDR